MIAAPEKTQARSEPMQDVSLVIVHVNNHYNSFDCCRKPLKSLLNERLARNVYEHSAFYQSFLEKEVLNLGWDWQKRNKRERANFSVDGVNYSVVNNELSPGEYEIEGLSGRRFMLAGGCLGNCHKKAAAKIAQHIYKKLNPGEIGEMHISADLTYEIKQDEGETSLLESPEGLLKYSGVLSAGSHFVTLDSELVSACFSPEEPTAHLAVWSRSEYMLNYLRNKGRVHLK